MDSEVINSKVYTLYTLELQATKMSILDFTKIKGHKLVQPQTDNIIALGNKESRNGLNYYGDLEPFYLERDHNYCIISANYIKKEVDY